MKNHEWINWPDFLGSENIATKDRKYRIFNKARKFVHGLNLKSSNEWRKYCKGDYQDQDLEPLPNDIPKKPHTVKQYKCKNNKKVIGKCWTNWKDWLGTDFVATNKREYWTFTKAKKFVRTLNLWDCNQSRPNLHTEWIKYCEGKISGKPPKPNEIPKQPFKVYTNEWNGWPDWVGIRRK